MYLTVQEICKISWCIVLYVYVVSTFRRNTSWKVIFLFCRYIHHHTLWMIMMIHYVSTKILLGIIFLICVHLYIAKFYNAIFSGNLLCTKRHAFNSASTHPHSWSNCRRKSLHKYIQRKKGRWWWYELISVSHRKHRR